MPPLALLTSGIGLDAIEPLIGRPVHVDPTSQIWIDHFRWSDTGVTVIWPAVRPYAYVIIANIHRPTSTRNELRDLIAKLSRRRRKSDRRSRRRPMLAITDDRIVVQESTLGTGRKFPRLRQDRPKGVIAREKDHTDSRPGPTPAKNSDPYDIGAVHHLGGRTGRASMRTSSLSDPSPDSDWIGWVCEIAPHAT